MWRRLWRQLSRQSRATLIDLIREGITSCTQPPATGTHSHILRHGNEKISILAFMFIAIIAENLKGMNHNDGILSRNTAPCLG